MFRCGGCFAPIILPAIPEPFLKGAILGADVAKPCRCQLATSYNLSAQYTVIPVGKFIPVHTINIGDKSTQGRVPVSLQARLEAITVEVGAATIARPTSQWKRRSRAAFLGVSSLRQVRVFERGGGFKRGQTDISRTTTICVD